MSPYVDVGQVEGAFVMGLGLYTSEKVKFDPSTGQKLSNGTWVRRARHSIFVVKGCLLFVLEEHFYYSTVFQFMNSFLMFSSSLISVFELS